MAKARVYFNQSSAGRGYSKLRVARKSPTSDDKTVIMIESIGKEQTDYYTDVRLTQEQVDNLRGFLINAPEATSELPWVDES